MIAALFVSPRGPYSGRPDVDPWPEKRDARLYTGPHPVVAHPPCQTWGRAGRWHYGRETSDGGCFQAALDFILRYGGVLEHPAASGAWPAFGLAAPDPAGGWTLIRPSKALWTCRVEQGHYGHRARKATWLLWSGPDYPPPLIWGKSQASILPRPGRDPIRERRTGAIQRMGHAERERTPAAFAELLIGLATLARQ